MLERPNLSDEQIQHSLHEAYRLTLTQVTFLPIGYDMSASVFRVQATDGHIYFLKAKTGEINPASASVPQFLFANGLKSVVAPIPTLANEMWTHCGQFTLLLYLFIEGNSGMDIGLTPSQWIAFGATLRTLHETQLPDTLAAQLAHETFQPYWSDTLRQVCEKIHTGDIQSESQHAFAIHWQRHTDTINNILQRCESLGQRLQQHPPPFVVCHADCHTANLLIDTHRELHIVDWDQTLFAPRERDLMFVLGDSTAAFLQGYGSVSVNTQVLAYYRHEWVIQDMGDFAHRIFLSPNAGAETQLDAVRGFQCMFDKDDVVDMAMHYRFDD